ncbi:MAG: hypothetical protein R3F59_27435 [Myxococcota bacterium]
MDGRALSRSAWIAAGVAAVGAALAGAGPPGGDAAAYAAQVAARRPGAALDARRLRAAGRSGGRSSSTCCRRSGLGGDGARGQAPRRERRRRWVQRRWCFLGGVRRVDPVWTALAAVAAAAPEQGSAAVALGAAVAVSPAGLLSRRPGCAPCARTRGRRWGRWRPCCC